MARKRIWTDGDTAELLESLRTMREVCCRVQAKAPVRGEVYLAAEKLTGAIDEIAHVLTGNRKRFWGKGFSDWRS